MRLKKYLFNGGNLQPAEFNTKYSYKIALAIGYRVHRLHSLVHLLHQTGYRVYRPIPATQPYTLSSTTGYRVYRLVSLVHLPQQLVTECTDLYRLVNPVHLPQQLVTECTDQYWLHSLVHLLQETGYRVYRLVPATQPCTLASTTGYRVYRPVPAIQPCTLALAIGYIWLQPTGYKSTSRVLATQSFCTVLHPTGYINWLNIDQWLSKFIGDPSLPVFCWLQRITVYSKLPVMETWYRTELPKVNLVTENS